MKNKLIDEIKKLNTLNMTIAEIVDAVGSSQPRISALLKKYNIEFKRLKNPRQTKKRPPVFEIGQKINMLTVKENDNYLNIICECDCGTICTYTEQHLQRGNIISCGCWAKKNRNINRKGEGILTRNLEDVKTLSNAEVCEKYNVSPGLVSTWSKKNNIKLLRKKQAKQIRQTKQKFGKRLWGMRWDEKIGERIQKDIEKSGLNSSAWLRIVIKYYFDNFDKKA